MANSEISEDRCLEYIIERLADVAHFYDKNKSLSFKELSLKTVWKQIKGRSADNLPIPISLVRELKQFQRDEYLLLWDEIYDNRGFDYIKERRLAIFSKTAIVYIADCHLSPSIKKLLYEDKNYEDELLKKIACYAAEHYKPHSLSTVHRLELEERFYSLFSEEVLEQSEEEEEEPFFIALRSH